MQNAFGQPQSVLVLGGTSDIALAVVAKLAADRTKTVVLAGRNEERLAAAAATLKAAGATTVELVAMEASDTSSAAATVDAGIAAAGGSVDLVLIAVGLLGEQSTTEDDPSATIELFDVNLTWPAAALAALRTRLIAQGSGHVAVFSSVAGVRVRRANFSYGSTKAGLDAFTIGFADSVRSSGIKVQVIRPGFVHTKMTEGMKEIPFTTTAEVAADNIVKGLGSSAEVIWTPPILKAVFLVLLHLPAFVWRRMPG